MEKNSNYLTILVALIFLLLLIFFVFRFFFATSLADFGAAYIYSQKTQCKVQNDEDDPDRRSANVKVYTNGTRRGVDVTGDIRVKKNTCTVRVIYGPGNNDFYEITPDNKGDAFDSRTVTVPRGQEMKIHCRKTDNKGKCEWKYSRTSP